MALIFSFSIVVSLGIMSPGPGFIYTVTNAILHSKSRVLMSVLGIACANLLIATLAVTGFRTLFLDPNVNMVINLLGSLYLLYVAYKLFISQPQLNGEHSQDHHYGFRSGFCLQILNIKAILFISSAITVNLTAATDMMVLVLLPVITFLVSLLWYAFVGLTVQIERINRLLVSKVKWVNKGACLCIIALVTSLLYSLFTQS
ncbi:LysE family translocator [Vibrio ostreicida]|uniref:LysE family transporter n=1 Tax=Vibrio ostreicida TaxID=526588 RepID=A0ABT8BXD5_9VIBR|nr:LysE family transporter [Vibrio ostreicida]MDN3611334.1 LysE family transporter [Vibrio ostreicida]NPD09272.1 LysE family transporter [Vibrio ostreicida]